MDFRELFIAQNLQHPSMGAQDAVKLCYQAAFGAEHLLREETAARQYLEKEYEALEPDETALYEQIHPRMCRINLAAWKREGMPLEWLFRMFADTAADACKGGEEMFRECLDTVELLVREGAVSIPMEQWKGFLGHYPLCRPEAVHHSENYRAKERPAYRLVSARYISMLPVLKAAADLPQEGKIIAIDGRCASGKTTLAKRLMRVTGAGAVHMDDFFLPPKLRRPERLEEPGGNVHYERFMEEVLTRIKDPQEFRYRCFDCGTMRPGAERTVKEGRLRIVEGAYSCHPVFGDYMGLRVFCHVEPQEQLRRIEERNGAEMLNNFRNRWIPMEERYIRHCRIREQAHLVVS